MSTPINQAIEKLQEAIKILNSAEDGRGSVEYDEEIELIFETINHLEM